MSQSTHPLGMETATQLTAPTPSNSNTEERHHIVRKVLWVIGLIVLLTAAVLIKHHPGPWPGELEFSRAVQAIHYWPWLLSTLMFFSSFNDIPPSIAAMVAVVLFLLIMRWIKQAIFFALTVGFGNAMNILIGDFVLRPRPSAKLIHVDTPLLFNSFPSGHTEHDVVFYGGLLYLTFTRAVREWRYRWILIPFQLFAITAILAIGYSRVLEGEHWVGDVLGGYLSGITWLSLAIFVYHHVNHWLARRQASKREQATSTKPAA